MFVSLSCSYSGTRGTRRGSTVQYADAIKMTGRHDAWYPWLEVIMWGVRVAALIATCDIILLSSTHLLITIWGLIVSWGGDTLSKHCLLHCKQHRHSWSTSSPASSSIVAILSALCIPDSFSNLSSDRVWQPGNLSLSLSSKFHESILIAFPHSSHQLIHSISLLLISSLKCPGLGTGFAYSS